MYSTYSIICILCKVYLIFLVVCSYVLLPEEMNEKIYKLFSTLNYYSIFHIKFPKSKFEYIFYVLKTTTYSDKKTLLDNSYSLNLKLFV